VSSPQSSGGDLETSAQSPGTLVATDEFTIPPEARDLTSLVTQTRDLTLKEASLKEAFKGTTYAMRRGSWSAESGGVTFAERKEPKDVHPDLRVQFDKNSKPENFWRIFWDMTQYLVQQVSPKKMNNDFLAIDMGMHAEKGKNDKKIKGDLSLVVKWHNSAVQKNLGFVVERVVFGNLSEVTGWHLVEGKGTERSEIYITLTKETTAVQKRLKKLLSEDFVTRYKLTENEIRYVDGKGFILDHPKFKLVIRFNSGDTIPNSEPDLSSPPTPPVSSPPASASSSSPSTKPFEGKLQRGSIEQGEAALTKPLSVPDIKAKLKAAGIKPRPGDSGFYLENDEIMWPDPVSRHKITFWLHLPRSKGARVARAITAYVGGERVSTGFE